MSRPELSRDGRSALFTVEPRHDPESPQARAMVDRLKEIQVGDAGVRVGGSTASVEDFKDLVSGSMWKILMFVLAFSYLVLLVLLRSVLLPLKAVLMTLLSVGAAYGVLVAVFQWGWLDGFAGFQSLGYVNTMTPPLLLAIVFGLSMDYEVFLLSRIRERYDATGDTRRSVAQGLAASAATISSAALIMVAVFAVSRARRALDQGDRPGPVGCDRPGCHHRPPDPGAGDDGDHGPLELVAAAAAGPGAAAHGLRGAAAGAQPLVGLKNPALIQRGYWAGDVAGERGDHQTRLRALGGHR